MSATYRLWIGGRPGDQGTLGNMPEKESGRHRWIVTALYTVTDGQASAAYVPGTQVNLDHENRIAIYIGCWDCEQVYEKAKGTRCPANDTWTQDSDWGRTG